jgi:hypothetical protein
MNNQQGCLAHMRNTWNTQLAVITTESSKFVFSLAAQEQQSTGAESVE